MSRSRPVALFCGRTLSEPILRLYHRADRTQEALVILGGTSGRGQRRDGAPRRARPFPS